MQMSSSSNLAKRKVNTPTILQMEALECGAASLAMIMGYYGKFISLEVLRIECGVSRDGTKASSVIKAAKKFGFDAHGFRMEIEGLADVKLPVILFWNFNHFVVLEGYSKGKYYLNDPAVGKRIVTAEEFDDSFTGVVLTFEPSADFRKSGKKPAIWPRLKKRLVGLRSTLSFLVLLSVLFFIPGFIYPSFSRFFIDNVLIGGELNLIKPLILAMGLTVFLNVILTIIQNDVLLKFNSKLSLSTGAKFVDHIFRMPVQFFIQRFAGELVNRIGSINTISSLITQKLVGIVIQGFSCIFFLVLMFIYDVPLTLLCLFSTAITVVVYQLTAGKIKNKSFKIQMESGKLSGVTMSGIEMIESLKANGSENDFFQQWSGQQAKVLIENQKLSLTNMGNSIAPNIISQVLGSLILCVGAFRVMDGHLTIGMLMAYQMLSSNFSNPINSFVSLGQELLEVNADMQRVDDVLDYPIEKIFKDDQDGMAKEDDSEPFEKLNGYISLKDVVFGYNPVAAPLLNGLSLELTPGKRIALVGSTGSGKSTIGKLVSCLYTPWSGEVLFDGKPLKEIPRKVFSASVSVVDQSISLFDGTVKDNITMWNQTIPEEDYIQAAKDACIHDVIASRPEGYYTKVIEGGRNFSGGQRQRLEIARALATNPRILIMDEATSALDAITEQTVDSNIRRRGCTSIIVAHRLSTIRDCDEIIVLQNGQIVQRGSHEELVGMEGLYSELIKTM